MKCLNTSLQRYDSLKPEDIANTARVLTTDKYLQIVIGPTGGKIPETYRKTIDLAAA